MHDLAADFLKEPHITLHPLIVVLGKASDETRKHFAPPGDLLHQGLLVNHDCIPESPQTPYVIMIQGVVVVNDPDYRNPA